MVSNVIPYESQSGRSAKRDMTIKNVLKNFEWILETVFFISICCLFYLLSPIEINKRLIYIQKGSITHIVSQLSKENRGVAMMDKYYIALTGSLQHGWIELSDNKLSRIDFYKELTTAKAAMSEVTLIPGETTYVVLKNLAKEFCLDFSLLEKNYRSLSRKHSLQKALLIPQTYKVPYGLDELSLITYLIDVSLNRHKYYQATFHLDDKLWKQLLIKASIIQKEAASSDEMPIIASVINNRLKRNMRLEMDGTLNYGKYSHQKVTPKRIREDKSTYNTYKHRGLPKEPIALVSNQAILAVLSPAKSEYLYFMRNNSGKHTFTKSYKEHLKVIRDVQKRNINRKI